MSIGRRQKKLKALGILSQDSSSSNEHHLGNPGRHLEDSDLCSHEMTHLDEQQYHGGNLDEE
jgi:hypothetical protein